MQRVRILLALLLVGVVGAGAAFAIPAIGARSTAAKTVTIKVTASEWKFKLSKASVPIGNDRHLPGHQQGEDRARLQDQRQEDAADRPGKTKSIKVVFKKKGKLTFLCTVTGHAKLGMTGKFGVGVANTITTTTTTTTTGGGGGGAVVHDPDDDGQRQHARVPLRARQAVGSRPAASSS